MMIKKVDTHCCELMNEFVQDERVPVRYDEVLREYFMPLLQSPAIQCIIYCPWCGSKLPKDLRDEYYDLLEREHNITPDDIFQRIKPLPKEFQSDMWWKNRGL